jgi:hypothetical protein
MAIPLLFGPYGVPTSHDVDRFAANGANAVWFHGFNPQAFETCEASGIAACVEFKTFRADFSKHPELIPVGVDGVPIRYGRLVQGVCLSQQAFLEEIEAALQDGLRSFKPAGIWFDYLTYGGWFETPNPDLQESCFCAECITEFCEATGIDATTPAEILGTHADPWTQHKCERVAKYAAQYAALVRTHLPECIIGAYMCPWTPGEYDSALRRIFAQDYSLLAPAIDVFTPLIYAKKSGRTSAWGRELLDQMSSYVPWESRTGVRRSQRGRRLLDRKDSFVPQSNKVQLILDVLDFPDSLTATAEAGNPSWGIQMFGGGQVFEDPETAGIFRSAVDRIRQAAALQDASA